MEDLGSPDQNGPEDWRRIARLECEFHLLRAHCFSIRNHARGLGRPEDRKLTGKSPLQKGSRTFLVEQAQDHPSRAGLSG